MRERGGRSSSTPVRRAEGRRAIARALLAASMSLAGCALARGRLPAIAKTSPEDGFKMLQPHAVVRRCRGSVAAGFGRPDPELLGDTVRDALARDEEANGIRNVTVQWTWRSFGLYGWHCIEIEGDLVRSTSTVLVPMVGEHGGHAPR